MLFFSLFRIQNGNTYNFGLINGVALDFKCNLCISYIKVSTMMQRFTAWWFSVQKILKSLHTDIFLLLRNDGKIVDLVDFYLNKSLVYNVDYIN